MLAHGKMLYCQPDKCSQQPVFLPSIFTGAIHEEERKFEYGLLLTWAVQPQCIFFWPLARMPPTFDRRSISSVYTVCTCVCASVHLCVSASVYLCICLSLHLCICAPVHLCICVSVHLCVSASVCLHLCVSASVYLCICLSLHLCICASVYLCACASFRFWQCIKCICLCVCVLVYLNYIVYVCVYSYLCV